ncbi:rhamnulokinase [Microbacterium gorillae]|uniref:rhamnulokinase n=1 Tax=Microbacterium gorillae TaxID=1231063 RepID=UPI00058B5F17|nr:rhamnulokinase family protein [Microbacterium gorillae]
MTGAVAAIDLGATSGRVIVGHVGPDTLRMEQVARFGNGPVDLGGSLHWDVTGLYAQSLAGLRDALRTTPGIVSIGVDSWAVDYALLRGGRLLGEPFHYRDERTRAGAAAVDARLPHAKLYARNGLQFLPFNTLYQLAAEDPAVLEIADRLLLVPDLLAFWLTGRARTEVTNASTTGLLDARTRAWDEDLIARLGLPRGVFADLVQPGAEIGRLRPVVAAALGAPEALGVTAVGSHDTASAVVAVPMDPATAVYISCGTWGLVGAEVAEPVLSDAARRAGFTNEGGVDDRIRLLHNVMGLWILSETVRGWEREGERVDLPALLAAAAAEPEPARVFDVDDERFLAPGEMTARIDAWYAEHDVAPPRTRAAYARAIVESLAEAFARTAHQAAELAGIDLRTIHIVGGGALNTLLCERTATRAGVRVLAGPVEATALGNVLVQARAHGLVHGTLEDLRTLVARTHEVTEHRPGR